MNIEQLRYPIGQFVPPEDYPATLIATWISQIEGLPNELRLSVEGLTDEQLDTPYRRGGWTVRQVVHHLPDSHLNSFIRFKWALTEQRPVIKAYDEQRWAELPDYTTTPIGVSLELLDALHRRWIVLLRALEPTELDREFIHPDAGPQTLSATIGAYAWHGKHDLAHIQGVMEREGW